MSEERSSDVEVFVHKKIVVSFRCPACNLEKSINVEKIKDVSHWKVNATCRRCAHKFKVSFNFRKYYRKETSLHGRLYTSFETLEPFRAVRGFDVFGEICALFHSLNYDLWGVDDKGRFIPLEDLSVLKYPNTLAVPVEKRQLVAGA